MPVVPQVGHIPIIPSYLVKFLWRIGSWFEGVLGFPAVSRSLVLPMVVPAWPWLDGDVVVVSCRAVWKELGDAAACDDLSLSEPSVHRIYPVPIGAVVLSNDSPESSVCMLEKSEGMEAGE